MPEKDCCGNFVGGHAPKHCKLLTLEAENIALAEMVKKKDEALRRLSESKANLAEPSYVVMNAVNSIASAALAIQPKPEAQYGLNGEYCQRALAAEREVERLRLALRRSLPASQYHYADMTGQKYCRSCGKIEGKDEQHRDFCGYAALASSEATENHETIL